MLCSLCLFPTLTFMYGLYSKVTINVTKCENAAFVNTKYTYINRVNMVATSVLSKTHLVSFYCKHNCGDIHLHLITNSNNNYYEFLVYTIGTGANGNYMYESTGCITSLAVEVLDFMIQYCCCRMC